MPRPSRPTPRRRRQAEQVVRSLIAAYPQPSCALVHRDAFELLVATVLSAQCTDARVNTVTPALFARFPDARSLATASIADVEAIIRPTGFFRAKARNLVALANTLATEHGGEVPLDVEALTRLAGVGRKTAHVVLGTAFRIASGVVVDTHVKRLSFRLGLTDSADPLVIEHDLAAIVPQPEWIDFSHRLIAHGRLICDARKPLCDACSLRDLCPKRGVKPRSK